MAPLRGITLAQAVGMMTRVLAVSLLCVLPTVATASASPAPDAADEATVPGTHPTIQEAIDAVAEGGVVRVGPGRHAEAVRIAGKRVHLVGAGARATRIVAPAGQAGVTFGRGGGGVVEGLAIEGADAVGVRGEGPPGAVMLRDVRIEGTRAGIAGHFRALTADGVRISDTAGPGVTLAGLSGTFTFLNGRVSGAGEVGLIVTEVEGAPLVYVGGSTLSDNAGGGIAIHGRGRASAWIVDTRLLQNGLAGIVLDQVASARVHSVEASGNTPTAAGRWGDGIVAIRTGDLRIEASHVTHNARAGVSLFGATAVMSRDEVWGNRVDLVTEVYRARRSSFIDEGGPTCRDPSGQVGVSCRVASIGFDPPRRAR
jgi:hypothetical protein